MVFSIKIFFAVLGSKDKVNPKNVIDTIEEPTPSTSQSTSTGSNQQLHEEMSSSENSQDESINEAPSGSADATSRFKSVRGKVKPMTKTETILDEIVKDRKSKENQFEFIKTHLSKTEKQRDRFLDIIEQAFSKKRKRDGESDSE